MQPGEFSIQAQVEDDRHTLLLTGDLDIASASVLQGAVASVCTDGARELVLDLSQLGFIDSTGLHAILTCRSLCQEHRCELSVVPGSRQVQRVFEITRLVDRLPFRTSDATRADAPDRQSPDLTIGT
jgi:anti-sigma B factor antagonist